MATLARPDPEASLAARYGRVRALSLAIAAPLSDADATIQPMPDASPAKWHLAHTTWFFETFLLRDHVPGYRPHDERWAYLFNSYYEGEGDRHARPRRGMLSRPSLDEIRAWRAAVDAALLAAIDDLPADSGRARPQPRAAASGADADGSDRDLRRKSAAPGAVAGRGRSAGRVCRRCAGSRGRTASPRSAPTAPASPSIASGRGTASSSIRTRSPTGR